MALPNQQRLATKPLLWIAVSLVLLSLGSCGGCNQLPGNDQSLQKDTERPPGLPPGSTFTPPGAKIDPGGILNLVNTCYLNSVLQIIAKLYPDAFDADTTALGKAGKALVDTIKDDQKGADREQAQALYEAFLQGINATKPDPKKHWTKNHQEDAAEAIGFLFDKIPGFSRGSVHRVKKDIVSGRFLDSASDEQFTIRAIPMTPGTPCLLEGLIEKSLADSDMDDVSFKEIATTEAKAENDRKAQEQHYPGYKAVIVRGEKVEIQIKGKARYTYTLNLGNLQNNILPIQLGRFIDANTKNNTKLPSPFNLTIQRKHIHNGASDVHYQLVGFVVHHGSGLHSGHYTAYIKNNSSDWVHYNDNKVTKVADTAAEAAAQQAYLYFYEPTP